MLAAVTPDHRHRSCGAGNISILFSGAGGFKLGFSRAGLRPLLCVDNNQVVAATHRFNYPDDDFLLADLGLPEVQKKTFLQARLLRIPSPRPFPQECRGITMPATRTYRLL